MNIISKIFWVMAFNINLFANAQEINGIWMQNRVPNMISGPSVSIIEISEDSIFAYDFDKFSEKGKIKFSDNSLVLNDSISVGIKFINSNCFEYLAKNPIEKEAIKFRYVRLLPTKDKNNLVESLKNKIYQISLPDEKVTFELGKKLHADNAIVINDPQIVADYSCIEKIRNTYFLCFYVLEYRTHAFPIKEINENHFSIYGIPNEENELIVERID